MAYENPKYETLVLIGNGFDLAHGYKTDYNSFTEIIGKNFFCNYKRFLVKYCGNTKEWNAFEKKLEQLVAEFYQNDISGNSNVANDIFAFNYTFAEIQNALIKYLKEEIARVPFRKITSIQNYSGTGSVALNFNYTSVAENYFKNVIYVHGSLRENEIVLGYDSPDPFCLATYENRKWFKALGRERLKFSRYLKQLNDFSFEAYNELCAEYEEIQKICCSGKGLEAKDLSCLKYASLFANYSFPEYTPNAPPLSDFPYNDIKNVILLGHSIKSDETFLKDILDHCKNIEQIVLFTYKGEKDSEMERKRSFFQPYCRNIKKEAY